MTKKATKDLVKKYVGYSFHHDRLGKVTVTTLDEKNGKTIAILSCGEWVNISELVFSY